MTKPTLYIDKDYKKVSGSIPIYMRVYLNNSYLKLLTGIDVLEENWDKDKQIITGARAKESNLMLKEFVGRAADIILKYKVNKLVLTKDLFIKEFSNPTVLTNLCDFMEDQILKRHNIADETRKNHLAVMHKLREFNNDTLLIDVDHEFLQKYDKYLRKIGNGQNTIHGNFKVLKVYIRVALRLALIKKNPFDYFKSKILKTYPTFLTELERTELVNLYESNRLTDTCKKVLRQFLFSCFTGMRVSDIKNIRYENIDVDNRIKFKPVKTSEITANVIEFKLTPYAIKLIKDENNKILKGTIFNEYASQKLNVNLKDIASVAKIKKNLTMHVGRHTFATIFLRKSKAANGILILKKILGHSKLETTMVYMHVIDEDIDHAMDDFD